MKNCASCRHCETVFGKTQLEFICELNNTRLDCPKTDCKKFEDFLPSEVHEAFMHFLDTI